MNTIENQNVCFLFSEQLEQRIRLTNASPKENLKVFGDDMVQLVDMLERAHKNGQLKRMPVGPLGNFIEVKNAKYRPYVEDVLGMMLTAFCVDNSEDLVVFRNVLKNLQMARQPSVLCAPFSNTVYNVTGKCVVPDAHTVRLMDVIVVQNPIAMNCLIDSCSIETILFAESFDHASHLTSKKENVPRNLSKLILLEPYSEYFPAPAYRSYSKMMRQTRYLRVDGAQREL